MRQNKTVWALKPFAKPTRAFARNDIFEFGDGHKHSEREAIWSPAPLDRQAAGRVTVPSNLYGTAHKR